MLIKKLMDIMQQKIRNNICMNLLIAQVVITKFYQEWVQYVQIVNIQLDISMEREEERGMEDFLHLPYLHHFSHFLH